MSLESLVPTKEIYNNTINEISIAKIKIAVPMIAMIAIVLYGYYEREEFIYDINHKNNFICKSIVKGGFKLTIDKRDGWILKDGHFIKGNSTISINMCKPARKSHE